ncbi:MAG: hypothetical protein WBO19_17690 [Terriglobia bacterium]
MDRDPDALHRGAGRVRGHLHGAEGSKFNLELLPLVPDEVEKEFDYNASGAAQIRSERA